MELEDWRRRVARALRGHCQSCRGIRPGTCIYCPVCRRVLCTECNPVHEANLCPLYKCTRCRVERTAGAGGGDKVREIQRMLDLVAESTKSGTWAVQRRGLAHFVEYLEGQGGRLPAQEMDVALWVTDFSSFLCFYAEGSLSSPSSSSFTLELQLYCLLFWLALETLTAAAATATASVATMNPMSGKDEKNRNTQPPLQAPCMVQ